MHKSSAICDREFRARPVWAVDTVAAEAILVAPPAVAVGMTAAVVVVMEVALATQVVTTVVDIVLRIAIGIFARARIKRAMFAELSTSLTARTAASSIARTSTSETVSNVTINLSAIRSKVLKKPASSSARADGVADLVDRVVVQAGADPVEVTAEALDLVVLRHHPHAGHTAHVKAKHASSDVRQLFATAQMAVTTS